MKIVLSIALTAISLISWSQQNNPLTDSLTEIWTNSHIEWWPGGGGLSIDVERLDTVPQIICYIDTSLQIIIHESYFDMVNINSDGDIVTMPTISDTIARFYDYDAHWMKGYITYEIYSRDNTPGASDGTWNERRAVYLDENKQRLSHNIIIIH